MQGRQGVDAAAGGPVCDADALLAQSPEPDVVGGQAADPEAFVPEFGRERRLYGADVDGVGALGVSEERRVLDSQSRTIAKHSGVSTRARSSILRVEALPVGPAGLALAEVFIEGYECVGHQRRRRERQDSAMARVEAAGTGIVPVAGAG